MTDIIPAPHSSEGPDAGRPAAPAGSAAPVTAPAASPFPGRPRWVIVSAAVAVALVAAFVIMHLAGGGMRGHG
ncbi:hypothetical protein [Streptomyces sp. NPDC059909]|uniref:hypothetical protein n=1 Tax=Streptomyces sp. NPDC059909 TaxID=3346998 RepID=UPI003660D262